MLYEQIRGKNRYMAGLQGKILVGRTGQKYRVEEALDLDEMGSPKGAMARVFRVFDVDNNRHLAAKVINPRLLDEEPEMRSRFLGQFYKEARIMQELKHPAIVLFYDYNTERELPFLVMDLIDGESLDDRLRREGRLTFADAMSILNPVMEALAYAHSKGVVHRDIKPSNILMDNLGNSYLTDFGIARAAQESGLSDRTALTLGSFQLGTPMYMSPEQALRLPQAVGPHTDQYSLAVVIWRMLAGRYYLSRTDIKEDDDYSSIVIGGQPLPLSRYAPDVPPRAQMAIMQALSKSPYDRFRSISHFLNELTKALANPDWAPAEEPLKGWQEPDWFNFFEKQIAPNSETSKTKEVTDTETVLSEDLMSQVGFLDLAPEKKTSQPLNLTLPSWLEEEKGQVDISAQIQGLPSAPKSETGEVNPQEKQSSAPLEALFAPGNSQIQSNYSEQAKDLTGSNEYKEFSFDLNSSGSKDSSGSRNLQTEQNNLNLTSAEKLNSSPTPENDSPEQTHFDPLLELKDPFETSEFSESTLESIKLIAKLEKSQGTSNTAPTNSYPVKYFIFSLVLALIAALVLYFLTNLLILSAVLLLGTIVGFIAFFNFRKSVTPLPKK